MLGGAQRMLQEGEGDKATRVGATMGRFFHYFRTYRLQLVLLLVFLVSSTLLQVEAPRVIGQAVDCYMFPSPDSCWYASDAASLTSAERLSGLGGLSLILLGMFVTASALTGIAFYTMRWMGERVLRRIRIDLFQHLHLMSLGYYSRSEAGNDMSRIINDMTAIQQMFSFALMNVASGILLIGSVMLSMFSTNVPYALISLTIVPFMAFATFYFSNQARKAYRVSRKEMGSVNADLQEKIAGAREVQAFSNERESIDRFRMTNAANRDANVKAAAFTSALSPTLEALGYVAMAIVVLVGGLSVIRNEALLGTSVISLGTIVAFVLYVQNFNRPIQQISVLWANIQNAIAGGERIFELLDNKPDIVDKPGAIALPVVAGEVEFDDVYAEYNPGETVLKGVSFKAEPGQIIAIVGPTGAGKTTIINLLPRMYDVTGGAVRVDGHDVRDVQVASLRSQIGVVLQDTFLFSQPIMENIRYGRLDATDEDVIEAARMVGADSFIERLPDGYNTRLGERGGGLSQGQRQLIAIARVALMQPRVLILDEATSSVDTRTERIIQAAFAKMLEGRTSFVIAHRLSTIRNADVVMMLVDGQIIERGTHDELITKGGAYYDLYMSQFQREEKTATPDPAGD
jgi:ATP-binding cassette subfamily B protein